MSEYILKAYIAAIYSCSGLCGFCNGYQSRSSRINFDKVTKRFFTRKKYSKCDDLPRYNLFTKLQKKCYVLDCYFVSLHQLHVEPRGDYSRGKTKINISSAV